LLQTLYPLVSSRRPKKISICHGQHNEVISLKPSRACVLKPIPRKIRTPIKRFKFFVREIWVSDPGNGPIGFVSKFRAVWWYLCVLNTNLESNQAKIDLCKPLPKESSKVCPNSAGYIKIKSTCLQGTMCCDWNKVCLGRTCYDGRVAVRAPRINTYQNIRSDTNTATTIKQQKTPTYTNKRQHKHIHHITKCRRNTQTTKLRAPNWIKTHMSNSQNVFSLTGWPKTPPKWVRVLGFQTITQRRSRHINTPEHNGFATRIGWD